MTKISRITLGEEAIDLFLEYRDAHGFSEEQAQDKAIAEIQEYEVLEFDSTEQDRGIAEAREEGIDEIPLRAVLDWYMCSDPWPVWEPYQNQETVTEWLDGVCKARGYADWVEAYHKMPAERLKEKP